MMRATANLITVMLLAFTAATASAETGTVDEQIALIRTNFNVEVHYQFNTNLFFPAEWQHPTLGIAAEPIEPAEAARLLPIINQFLSAHPAPVIDTDLEHIYLLDALSFRGKPYGSTRHGKSLYIVSRGAGQGYDDTFLLCRLHSEFSSILMEQHTFPTNNWLQFNPDGFNYSGNGFEVVGNPSCYDSSERSCMDGFLVNFCRSSLDNDFSIMSSWLFTKPDELNAISQRHDRIREKQAIAEQFYRSLNGQYVFD